MPLDTALSTTQAWWVTFLVLGTVVLVAAVTSTLVSRATLAAPRGSLRPLAVHPTVLTLWAGVALATSFSVDLGFVWFLPFALVPIAAGTAATWLPAVAATLSRISVPWLVGLQTYRVVGAIFLYPYMTEGILTGGFAWPAGVGDVLTGLAAPLVAVAVARDPVGSRRLFLGWTAFGILDLVVAPTSAALFGFGVDGGDPGFPVTAIPLFLGPPFGILIHVVTWRAFHLQHVTATQEHPSVPADPPRAGIGRGAT